MSGELCPELAKVALAYDGRLDAAQRLQFSWHMQSCRCCNQEQRRLEKLRGALLSLPLPTAPPERVAHGRQRLLEAARAEGAAARRANRSVRPKRIWIYGGALAACAGLVLFLVSELGRRSTGEIAETPTTTAGERATRVVVRASAGARWSRRSRPDGETLKLSEGRLHVRVVHGAEKLELKLELPDGEIEDVGTVFTVSVQDGRTRRVQVDEGGVLLRLHGREPFQLSAGDSWTDTNQPEPANSRSGAQQPRSGSAASQALHDEGPARNEPPASRAARSEVPSASLAAKGALAKRTGTAGAPRSAQGSSSESGDRASVRGDEAANPARTGEPPAPAPCPAASQLQVGTAAFQAGQYARAVRALRQYSATCGSDAHAEDVAYLTLVSLLRAGRQQEARQAARSYLARFPHGFRRKEAERVLSAD